MLRLILEPFKWCAVFMSQPLPGGYADGIAFGGVFQLSCCWLQLIQLPVGGCKYHHDYWQNCTDPESIRDAYLLNVLVLSCGSIRWTIEHRSSTESISLRLLHL